MLKIRASFWVVLSLFVACVVITRIPLFQKDAVIFSRLAFLWGGLLAVSFLWTYYGLRNIRFERRTRTLRHHVGEPFEEFYRVTNQSWLLRPHIEVLDRSRLPASQGTRVLTAIGAHQARSYQAFTLLTRRGLFNLGPTELRSGDMFGLFQVTRTFVSESNLLVTPYMVDLSAFASPPGLLFGGRSQRRRTLDTTPYAASVREYSQGDPLNRVHWPSTARRNKLMVKEFELDPQAEAWIFLDAQEELHTKEDEDFRKVEHELADSWLYKKHPTITLPRETIEYAVSIAASLVKFYIQNGQAVGLGVSMQQMTVLPAEKGERQLNKLLETLAFIEPSGKLPLHALTSMQGEHIPMGSTLVLITPSPGKEVYITVEDLLRRKLQPVVVLLDASSFGGYASTQKIFNTLTDMNIPVYQIKYGDNLKTALQVETLPSQPLNWWKESCEAASISTDR
ncbi:MAG: DUF58 domain-containing protein [Anaerolineaceae bacterium]